MDNEVILSNLRHMAEVKAPVTVRVPLIPGFNADVESLSAIARFVAAQDGLSKKVSLLPYHTLGKAKYAALGRPYPADGCDIMSPETIRELTEILKANELEVSIGS
jgi:pyruvate formate lyase activating enzyme